MRGSPGFERQGFTKRRSHPAVGVFFCHTIIVENAIAAAFRRAHVIEA
jgi:hypothetical protein